MRLLLDTHIVLWQLADDPRLTDETLDQIAQADELFFSAVSYAEIGIKAATGKLVVPDDIAAQIASTGVRTLQLAPAHGLAVATLPVHHRDPFDRLLIAQARGEKLTLVSADSWCPAYEVDLIRA